MTGLPVKFQKVKYQHEDDYLDRDVKSAYGEEAILDIWNFGSLSWFANRNLWKAIFPYVPEKPSFITVYGVEGRTIQFVK